MAGAGPVAEVVIGSADPASTASFLTVFGLTETARVPLGAEYVSQVLCLSSEGPLEGLRLHAPDAPDRASVLIVPTSEPGSAPSGWQRGPRALDIYTTDIDASASDARAAGFPTSPEAVIAGGPMRMRQVLVTGPEGLPVVLVDSTHRRSSVCDLSDGPRHSEPHSIIWSVVDQTAELERWTAAGWSAGATISFAEPTVSDELSLPERPTPITMTMLSDEPVAPIRVELMTFDDHIDEARLDPAPSAPVRHGGLHAVLSVVNSVEAAVDAWGSGATFGAPAVTDDGRRAVGGLTVGGVRLVVVEPSPVEPSLREGP